MRNYILVSLMLSSTGAAQILAERPPAPTKPAAAKPAVRPAATRTVKDLKFKPLPEVRLPEITRFTMANGMKVFLLENHELPLVRGSAIVRVGNVFDPADKTGLADVFGEVMRTGGTKSKTGDQLNETLEGIAAMVESDVGETSGTVTFNTLTEHTDTVLGIFKDVLTEPEFRQDKIDVAKTQYRGVISRRNDQPNPIASREFERLLYGADTAWGRIMQHETLGRIERQDLIAYHQRYFFPENIILSVQGDFVTSTMREKLEKLFAGWSPKQPAVPALPSVSTRATPGAFLATKNDVNQTFFRIGHLGGTLKDKDYAALEVMADILGGGMGISRLFRKVRSEMGLAYNVSAGWNASYDHIGTFTISGSTKSESTVDTIRAVLGEVERIRTNEVSDEELRLSKESTLNSFVFNFDSPGKTLGRLVNYEYHNYPKDFIFQYQKALAAVTKADVLRVAKEYLRPQDFTVVAVGKPADFKTPLSALNLPVKDIDLSIPEPKRAETKTDAASLAQGKALLQKLQKAVGGGEKLAGVKDYSHTAQVAVLSVPGGLKVQQYTRMLPPVIRFEQKLPFGEIIAYYDGKGGGWFKGPQGVAGLPPPVAKQAQDELFRMHISLWLSDRNPDRQVNAIGANSVEISDKNGNWVKLHLDEATGLVAKSNYRASDGGGAVEAEAVYDDWKEVDGVKLPHKIKVAQGGKAVAEISIQEYKLSSGLKAEDLAAKP